MEIPLQTLHKYRAIFESDPRRLSKWSVLHNQKQFNETHELARHPNYSHVIKGNFGVLVGLFACMFENDIMYM